MREFKRGRNGEREREKKINIHRSLPLDDYIFFGNRMYQVVV